MHTLVLLRHGESDWNRENRFTGWTDVGLSEKGVMEARSAATLLRENGFVFDHAYTSVLRRAIQTLNIVLDEMDLLWIPVTKTWRLNERHYGALQGLNKAETAARYGDEQVHLWRRSYDVPPPPLDVADKSHPVHDPRYAEVPAAELPSGECLADTVRRFMPLWEDTIRPALGRGRRIIIAAHGNSLRALVKHLDRMSDEAIAELNIPTGIPLVYELDNDLAPLRHYYLGDEEAARKAAEAVAAQARNK